MIAVFLLSSLKVEAIAMPLKQLQCFSLFLWRQLKHPQEHGDIFDGDKINVQRIEERENTESSLVATLQIFALITIFRPLQNLFRL